MNAFILFCRQSALLQEIHFIFENLSDTNKINSLTEILVVYVFLRCNLLVQSYYTIQITSIILDVELVQSWY